MKYAHQYLQSAAAIIDRYDGQIPLAAFLKNYFSQYKKFGSKDRKHIAHLCYCYYRLGGACRNLSVEEKIRTALFLCHDTPGEWEGLFEPEWLANWPAILSARIAYVQSIETGFAVTAIFPCIQELSEGIDPVSFATAHLVQPDLFLRIRPGHEQTVTKKLNDAGIRFEALSSHCLALPNASKADTVIDIDREAVIQDYSSQRIAGILPHIPAPVSVWDCCAASGGKSILTKDILGNIHLTVSDIRPSILQNLQQRFRRAGIQNYHSFIANLSLPPTLNPKPQTTTYNLILCDAPCSGSGTWGRTPEQLLHFTKDQIEHYAALQKKIVAHIIPHLAEGGYLLYITCSVFRQENEEVVAFIEEQPLLEWVKTGLLKGYAHKADSMYAALFKKRALRAG